MSVTCSARHAADLTVQPAACTLLAIDSKELNLAVEGPARMESKKYDTEWVVFTVWMGSVMAELKVAGTAQVTIEVSEGGLEVADLLAGYQNENWGGFGYLGEREMSDADEERIAAADARVVREANARGWTAEDLFNWANSRDGRFFASTAFGWDDLDRAVLDSFPKVGN